MSSGSSREEGDRPSRRPQSDGDDARINPAFDPETGSKIPNITKMRPSSSLAKEEEEEEEHPLLSLHQSVDSEEKKVSRRIDQKGNGSGAWNGDGGEDRRKRDGRKPGGERTPPRRSACRTLFKVVASTVLLLSWLSLANFAIVNKSRDVDLPRIMTQFSDGMTELQSGLASFVRDALAEGGDRPAAAAPRIEQWEKRLRVGRDLLSEYDDAAGSASACEGALRAILETDGSGDDSKGRGGDLASMASSSTASADDATRALIARALLCTGEAQLALFSSLIVGSASARRARLTEARKSFEAATAIDPTDPSVRAGLGLTYLLLGLITEKENPVDLLKDEASLHYDASVQLVFQSIQHLKAAVGLTTNADEGNGNRDDAAAVRAAAMHNLGLAHLALDSMSSPTDVDGGTAHFLEWISSIKSSAPFAKVDSRVHLANEGASLLRSGRMKGWERAASVLESIVDDEVCKTDSMWSLSGRQKDMCRIARHNLSVALEALSGGEAAEDGYNKQLTGGGAKALDEVARWNAEAASSAADLQPGEDDESNVAASPAKEEEGGDDASPKAEDDAGEESEASSSSAAAEPNGMTSDAAASAEDETEAVPKEEETNGSESDAAAPAEVESEAEFDEETKGEDGTPRTPMQNALAALERAAMREGGGPQRTRLLLALARARSSAGDDAGAVDAALKAVAASGSDEEAESATSYLEMLMERMAEGGDSEGDEDENEEESAGPSTATREEEAVREGTSTSLVERSRDHAIGELQLKLELEKLRYKVLEQEMMLGRYRQQRNYNGEGTMRAIDYRREEEDASYGDYGRGEEDVVLRRDVPPRGRGSDANARESIVVSRTEEVVIEHEAKVAVEHEATADDAMETDTTSLVEEVEEDRSPAEPKNETDADAVRREDSDAGNETASSEPRGSDAESETEAANATDDGDAESVEDETSTTEEEDDAAVEEGAPVEEEPVEEPIELPSLYRPERKEPGPIPPTAKSYMKMADAYLDKGKYALAAKQFLKVIKKAPDHLPAHLGYATATERAGKSRQIVTAALAYGNATRVAVLQGERVDPTAGAGAGGLAENILRRAVRIAKSAPATGGGGGGGRAETLRRLAGYSHTFALAADVHYEIGMETAARSDSDDVDGAVSREEAKLAFSVANEFAAARNDTDIPYHIGSIIELARMALEHEGDGKKVVRLFQKVKDVHMEDDRHVELLVLVGRAHVSLGETETAITEYTRALSFPECASTPSAHHELAIALKKTNGDAHEIDLHFEKALDMGMDPTPEIVDALGERNISVMRALNRQYYRNVRGGGGDGRTSGGSGVMGGGGVGSQSASAFAPQPKQEATASSSVAAQQSETLALLEQGAATYDGQNMPMGGEAEGAESSLSSLKARKEQRGSESNLSNLKR